MAVILLSVLPDLDFAVGLLTSDVAAVHGTVTHSLIFGLAVSTLAAAAVWLIYRRGSLKWFVIALGCYVLHLLMDSATVGRGVTLFWPLSEHRVSLSWKLFYGLRWSQGLVETSHLITVASELLFVVGMTLLAFLAPYVCYRIKCQPRVPKDRI